MADTEAWRFVRAFGAREAIIRKKWELEERGFAGGREGMKERKRGKKARRVGGGGGFDYDDDD